MNDDSTNLEAPDFGPGLPVYPALNQLCRVTASSIGNNVYPAFVQQYTGNLTLRDREPCYVQEPNQVILGPGIYDARLIGNYLGLPLFATTCCSVGTASSSMSGSPTSAAPAPPPARDDLGSGNTPLNSNLSLHGVTVDPGSLLIVVVSVLGNVESATVTFAGLPMTRDLSVALPGGSPVVGTLFCFSLAASGTGDIVVSVSTPAALTVQATQVPGLAFQVVDQTVTASGLASSPDTGTTAPTVVATEYAQGAFLLVAPSASWLWRSPYTTGGQDQSVVVAGIAVSATEGFNVLSTIQTTEAVLAINVPPPAWAGLVATYK